MAPARCSCFPRLSLNFRRDIPSEYEELAPPEPSDAINVIEVPVDDVLLNSSHISDFIAPPWHLVNKYKGVVSEALWEDPQGQPKLTAKQKRRLSTWVRLAQREDVKAFFTSTPCSDRIRQGFVADCSFLSCLATLADYEHRYNVPLLTNVISLVVVDGRDTYELVPSSSDNKEQSLDSEPTIAIGVKMYFNGIARCVFVDDWVPARDDGRLLCAHSSDPTECWVTILEKAFVKLNGGSYTVNGTNPGIDIYHLTGWIPDIVPLPSNAALGKGNSTGADRHGSKWDDIWDILYAGFCSGSCVVCVGTGEIADAAPSGPDRTEGISISSGIVSDHAYGVLQIKDISMPDKSRARLLYLKNPWGRVSWTQRFSPFDDASWTSEMQNTLKYIPHKDNDTGHFWIEWTDLLRWFSHLYISWKPNVFRNRITLNHVWEPNPLFIDSIAPEDVYLSLFNPQFKVTVAFGDHNSATLWLMLLQHRKRTDEALKYLALHVFSSSGPVVFPALPDVQGVYNNGECILVKLLVKRNTLSEAPSRHMLTGETVMAYETDSDTSILVLLSYYTQKIVENTPFTLKALCTRPIQIIPKPCVVKPHWHTTTINGEWNETNCGGSPNEVWNYFINPHYRLLFDEDSEAIVLLESKTPISLNLRIFQGRMATFRSLKLGHIVTSEEYKVHCCGVHLVFKAGQYVIIPSTFRSLDRGEYRIVIHSSKTCCIKHLPYPHADLSTVSDMYTKQVEVYEPVYFKVNTPTLVSIRIQIPYDASTDVFVIYASSNGAQHPQQKDTICNNVEYDNCFCLGLSCMFCGGPSGRFRPILCSDPQPNKSEGYDLILYSDMNGGNSKTGRVPSASARHLFQQRRTLNFTLVELLPSETPYKLTSGGPTTIGTVTFASDHPLTIL